MNIRRQLAMGGMTLSALLSLVACVEAGQPIRPADYLFRTGVVQNETYRPGSVSRSLSGSSYILPVYTFSIRTDGHEEVYNVRGFDVAEATDVLINSSDSVNIYKMPKSFPNVRTVGGVNATRSNFRNAMKEIGTIDIGDDLFLQKVAKK